MVYFGVNFGGSEGLCILYGGRMMYKFMPPHSLVLCTQVLLQPDVTE